MHHIAHPTPPLHPVSYHPTTHSSTPSHQHHTHAFPLSSAPSHSTFLFPPSSSLPIHHLTSEPPPSEHVKRSPVTPQRSPLQPVPRLAMAPPAVNYSDSYTFPPTAASSSTTSSSSSSLLSSLSPASQFHHPHHASLSQSPSASASRHSDNAFSPRQSSYIPILLSPSQAQADRLDSLRPDALTLSKSTSPLGGISHSISLPVLPPPAHGHALSQGSAGALYGAPNSDSDNRVLDSSIAALSVLMHAAQAGGEMSAERLHKHLSMVIEQLTSLKSSTHFRSTSLHNALFQTLALRRSTSDTMADQEVVDWISHEYLTPRRGSTSSESGVTLPLSHSLPSTGHHSHSLSHSHSFHYHRSHSFRSNSLSGVTLRSGSHPSLDALPSTSELNSAGRLVRAANLIRIIKRLSATTKLRRKHRLEEVKEMGPGMDGHGREEKMDMHPHTAGSDTSPLPGHSLRRKSHLDLPTSNSPLVYQSAGNASASLNAGSAHAASARSPSSQRRSLPSPIAASPSSKRSMSSRSQQYIATNSSPQLQPSPPSVRAPPKLRSPSSSSPSPYTSSPSSQSRNLSRSHSSSSSSTPTSQSRSSSLSAGPLYLAIVDRLVSDPMHAMLASLNDWNFDLFGFHALAGQRTLSCICAYLFDELGIFEQFSVRRETFAAFITAIEDGYHTDAEVPYHNNIHAADVALNTYFLLQAPALQASFSPLDCFAAVVAAAVHDYAHPGTNNAYQIAVSSEWAVRYNDICVLENMHCSEAFFVMRRPDCNIFEHLSPPARQEIRSTIIHQVLATDMQQHFKNLAELKSEVDRRRLRVLSAPVHSEQPPHGSSSDRMVLLANMLHSADLANPCKPLGTYLHWTERITAEFYSQGDREREQGLPVSLMMDRAKPNLERSQLGFIDVIVQPLWATLSEIAGSDVNACLRHLQTNRQYWLDRLPPATPRTRSRQGHSSQNSIGSGGSSGAEQEQAPQSMAVHEAPITTYVVPMS